MSAKKPSQAATRAADRIVKETVISLVCKEERDGIAAIIDEEIAEIRRPKYCKCGTQIFGETTMCWNCVNEYKPPRRYVCARCGRKQRSGNIDRGRPICPACEITK
jgi:hypothetical protein